MTQVGTIGRDLAKTPFQVHGVDASGAAAVRRSRRAQVRAWSAEAPRCLVGRLPAPGRPPWSALGARQPAPRRITGRAR